MVISLVVWVNIFLWFIRSPFLEGYLSSLLLLSWTLIGFFTVGCINELMEDGENIRPLLKWVTSSTTILFLVIWIQVLYTLFPYLPAFWHS